MRTGEGLTSTTLHSWARALLTSTLGLVALVLLYAYGVGFTSPAAGFFHDDGIYLVTAQALADGRGYRIISLPTEIAQTKYPIFFPLLLSFAWRMNPAFPDNLPLLRMVPFLAGLVWLSLVYLFVRREGEDRLTAAMIGVLGVASPLAVFGFTALLSETLFAVLVWAALAKLRELQEAPSDGTRSVIVAALLAAAAMNTRMAGLALVPAGWWSLRRCGRLRASRVFGAVALLGVLPWLIWSSLQQPASIAGLEYYSAANYRSWNVVLSFGWAEKARILGWNLLYLGVAPEQLLPARWLPWPVSLGIGLLVVWSLLHESFERPAVSHAFAWTYLGLLLLWAWLPGRLLTPVYPLLLLFLWRRLRRVVRGSRPVPLVGPVLCVVGTALLLNAGWAAFEWARSTERTGIACPFAACDVDWDEFRRAVEWIQERTPEETVLLGNLDPALYLYTGRKAVRPFSVDPLLLFYAFDEGRRPLGEPEAILRRARASGATYLVSIPVGSFPEEPYLERMLREIKGERPPRLVRVDAASGSRVTVYRIAERAPEDRAPAPTDP